MAVFRRPFFRPVKASPLGSFSAASAVTATLSGTVTASITESDIVTGNKTIILTLTGDTFVADGTAFDAQRQAIINGLNGI